MTICARIQVLSLPNASTKGTSSIPVQRSLSIPSIIILKSSTMMMINMQHDERDPTNYVDWDPWARPPCSPHGPYGYWQGSPLHDHDHHHPNHRQNHHHHWTRIIIPRSLSHLRQSNWSSSTSTSVDSKSLTSAKAMLTKIQGSYIIIVTIVAIIKSSCLVD